MGDRRACLCMIGATGRRIRSPARLDFDVLWGLIRFRKPSSDYLLGDMRKRSVGNVESG